MRCWILDTATKVLDTYNTPDNCDVKNCPHSGIVRYATLKDALRNKRGYVGIVLCEDCLRKAGYLW